MNAIHNIEFQKFTTSQSACYNTASSIEDDLIAERLRQKQVRGSSSCNNDKFHIMLFAVKDISETKKVYSKMSSVVYNNNTFDDKDAQDSSFATADSIDELIVAPKADKKMRTSILSALEFDNSTEGDFTPQFSPKRELNTNKLQKLLMGLSAFKNTVEKVQTKDVAFKFAHLKIFAQLTALNTTKAVKKELPVQSSSKAHLTDKKKQFYRQFFKTQMSGQFADCGRIADAPHTPVLRR